MDPLADETADDAAPMNAAPEPLCIQAAAVAAQQIALDEEEIRLAEERTAFELQQRHFAAHVEAKRRELLLLRAQVRAEHVAAQDAGQGDERQLSLLPPAECEQSEALEARERCLQDQVDELNQRIWRFNAEAELSRIHAKEAWDKLRQAKFRWRRRRNLERAAIRVRDQQLATAAQRIADARAQLERDQHAWLTQRQALEQELDGVNVRVQNQRRTMNEQEARFHQLEVAIVHRQQQLTALTPAETPSGAPAAGIESAVHDSTAGAAPQPNCPPLAAPPIVPHPRAIDLDCVAEDLADQRQQLVETWERLLAWHEEWHAERTQASADLEGLAQELVEREHCLHEREQANRRTEAELQERHEQATQAQQQLIAWGA